MGVHVARKLLILRKSMSTNPTKLKFNNLMKNFNEITEKNLLAFVGLNTIMRFNMLLEPALRRIYVAADIAYKGL